MITVTRPAHFRVRGHGRRVATTTPSPLATLPAQRVPRIARLMALAIVLDRRLRAGEFRSISEMARHYRVSQPRMTQILNLTLLPPEVIEHLLFSPESMTDRGARNERSLRNWVQDPDWRSTDLHRYD